MFKVFIFFTTVIFLYTPQLAFSKQSLYKLKDHVSAKEARAIEKEIQRREARAMEEEMRHGEEQIANQEDFHGEDLGQAQGVILTFKKYPVTGNQNTLLVKKLGKAGLKKDAEIQRFKMWIYNWKNAQEGIRAEMLCKEFLAFSFVESCKANALAHPGYTVDLVEGAKKMVQSAEQRLEKTKQTVKRAEDLVKKYQGMVADYQNKVKEAEQWVKTAEQKLQTAKSGGVDSQIKYAEGRLAFYKTWLENRKKWLGNSEGYLENRKEWLAKTKGWLERDIKWLAGRKEWLNKMQNALARRPLQVPPTTAPPQEPTQTPPQVPTPISSSGDNLKTCNIISHKLKLSHAFSYTKKGDSPLSDYWAQEMIGADLLKKEMQGLPPIKKHFIQLFDVNKPAGARGHDNAVKSLISDNGKHSVLPMLGENSIGLNQTPTTGAMVKYSDQMLSKAEGKCAHLKSGSSQGPQQGGSVQ